TALRQRRALLTAALEAARASDTPNRLGAQRDPGMGHGFPWLGRYQRMNYRALSTDSRLVRLLPRSRDHHDVDEHRGPRLCFASSTAPSRRRDPQALENFSQQITRK